jgi:hypothetical protein
LNNPSRSKPSEKANSLPLAESLLHGKGDSTASVAVCSSCGSANLSKYDAEIAVHLPYLKNSARPHIFLFPKLLICLNCGFTGFAVAETELRALAQVQLVNFAGDEV